MEGANFWEAAQAILEGKIEDWSREWVHSFNEMQASFDHPETRHIATYSSDGVITVHRKPGFAGRAYLQIGREEYDELEYPHKREREPLYGPAPPVLEKAQLMGDFI